MFPKKIWLVAIAFCLGMGLIGFGLCTEIFGAIAGFGTGIVLVAMITFADYLDKN